MDQDVPPTPNRSHVFSVTDVGRRATPRSGSSESPYGAYPRLGEGLRGAQRRDTSSREEVNGDVFGSISRPISSSHDVDSPSSAPLRRALSTGTRSAVSGNGNGTGDVDSPSPMPPLQRAASRLAEWRASSTTPARTSETRTATARSVSTPYTTPSRPSTSMAALNHETPSSSSRPLRSYRHSVTGEMSMSSVPLEEPIQLNGTHALDRTYTPSCNTTRRSTQGDSQHQRLLSDALATFESQLQRLPPMGHTTTNTIPEVFQNSQQIVQSLDSLNSLLRESMLHARNEEVHAELADDPAQIKLTELWATIGSESWDRLRITEDLVRTMTQFFLGVGKVLRDAASAPDTQNHNRTASLEEEVARRNTPEGSNSVSSSDKHSTGRLSRRSWEPRTLADSRAVARLASRERSGTTTSRPSSATQSHTQSSKTSSSEGRSHADGTREQSYTPPTARVTSATLLTSGSRRYSPMDSRLAAESPGPSATAMQTLDSQETLRPREPGSLPLPTRTRTLPPLAIPPSLPTLPSESLISRTPSLSERSDRRKISTGSNVTLRAESSLPPVIKPPNTTTALTTSLDSPLEIESAFSRTDSVSSSYTNGVTFSRPSPDSMSTLSGLRQQNGRELSKSYRPRTIASSLIEARSPISGSETERPARRIVVRPRASLDRSVVVDVEDGPPSRASTLTASRRERRRTVTSASEIFAEMR